MKLPATKYPSWIASKPVRLDNYIVKYLQSQGHYGESLSSIIARLLKIKKRSK